ncbi:MAG: DUF294 nucleotidyltransferase-like domain-containing protein, partial [Magnetovibrio sp.]|nr:DUF294 nucleotidyltransferase-like domain-containing protein [Magnetovibrio sp.]
DQDNGFIIDDYPDEDHTAIDAWFIDLAERLTQAMDRIGLPLCKGFVMATNPLWRKTISQWQDQVTLWSRKRNSVVLRHCDIFFDFKAAFTTSERGQEMTDALRRHVTETARDNKVFLGQLYAIDQDQRPALGWFRRFRTMRESDPPGYKGYLNLKHSGTLPLVEGMRLLCLREGLVINPTLDRLQALHEGGVLRDDEADYLAGGYRHISHLLMRQQIRDFKAGRNVTNFIHPGSLTKREKDILKDSFEAISALQDRLRLELTGNVF